MAAAVERYLVFRRQLGFALRVEGEELGRFARFADRVGHQGPLTTELAVRWATQPKNVKRLYHARRLDMVRRLAHHLVVFEPATQIPPDGLLGPSHCRRAPHIYSDEDVAALLARTRCLGPVAGLRPKTYTVLFGLLACTGIRISEALRLKRSDVGLASGVLAISASKCPRSRIVPLDPSAAAVLRRYGDDRDRYHRRRAQADTFFVSQHATSIKYAKVNAVFGHVRRQLGWRARPGDRLPRIHDFRHTFAVRRLLRWYDEDVDINRKIASLSSYLGHVKVSDTYWYLTAVPDLLAKPAARFEHFAGSIKARKHP